MKKFKSLILYSAFFAISFLFNLEQLFSAAPSLSWTGETGYTTDGINPDTGNTTTTFSYHIKYSDADNEQPSSGYPKLYILKSGIAVAGSPFIMTATDNGDIVYSDGKIYNYSLILAESVDYTYYFEARDTSGAFSTGTPSLTQNGPTVYLNSSTSDLTISIISYNGSSFTAGSTMNPTLKIANLGTISVITYRISLYLSKISDINLATKVSEINGLTLTGTINQNIDTTFSIPNSLESGSYYLGAFIDSNNQVAESNENNNIGWANTAVSINSNGTSTNNEVGISAAYCYPVPAHLSRGETIKFARFTPNARIKILTTAGQVVRDFTAGTTGDVFPWDGTTDNNEKIGSGVYIVYAKEESTKAYKIFKIIIEK